MLNVPRPSKYRNGLALVLAVAALSIAGCGSEPVLFLDVEVVDEEERDGPFGGELSRTGKAEFNLKVSLSDSDSFLICSVNDGPHSGHRTRIINTQIPKYRANDVDVVLELLDRDAAETRNQRALRDALKNSGDVLITAGRVYALKHGVLLTQDVIASLSDGKDELLVYLTKNPDTTLFDSYGACRFGATSVPNGPLDLGKKVMRDGRVVAIIRASFRDPGNRVD